MFANFAKLVGVGGVTFPYTCDEAYASAWGQWTHHQGTTKEDGTLVSVFKMCATDPNDRRLVLARNGVKRLKSLRHPNVLAYKDSAEMQEKGQTVIYLVTQPVKPLKLVLEELNLTGQPRDEYLAMGILHMTNAISFLNNDCKLIHGFICLDAVVVTETLDWKLHGVDLLSEHSLPPEHCLSHVSWMAGNQYKPAELGKADWDTIRDSPPWAVDAWGLGCLIQEVFSQKYMQSVENLRRTDVIPPALLADYQKLLSSNPSRRLNPSKVAQCKFLNNKLVDVVNFMENVAVKDAMDKETFFKRLSSAMSLIPAAVATRKILPLLSHALEFGGAPPHAVAPLLQIGNMLSSDEFNKRVVPTLSKLFASTDRALRRSLLENIDTFSQHLTTQVLEEQIFPHLQLGFSDQNAYIRELTLKSLLSLAPKLSNKTLVNSVLKHLSKLQVDEEASIRANTTVLLGNVAQYLGEATCKRVLVNAFTRALKDTFPPAKIAGLRAMVATTQWQSLEDAAMRVLPAVAPLAVDPVSEVRVAALQALEVFTAILREAENVRARELAAGGVKSEAGIGSMGAGAPALSASGSSMLTWAVSSLMSTTGLAIKPGGLPVPTPAAPSSNSAAPAATPAASAAARPPATAPNTASRPNLVPTALPAARSSAAARPTQPGASSAGHGSSQGGWADGDDWDEELQVDAEEVKARSRLAGSKPTSSGTASRAVVGKGAALHSRVSSTALDGWATAEEDKEEEGGWEGMDDPVAVKPRVPVRAPIATRPASGAAGSVGGAGKRPGAMKLGVQKLGASKAAVEFNEADW